jgi:hypothetical protein
VFRSKAFILHDETNPDEPQLLERKAPKRLALEDALI